MAKIIVTKAIVNVHKEHNHEGTEGLVRGLLFRSKYCPLCGESLQEKREVGTSRCSVCGQLLLVEFLKYHFCPECGAEFVEGPTADTGEPIPAQYRDLAGWFD